MRVLKREIWPYQAEVSGDLPTPDIFRWCCRSAGKEYNDWNLYYVSRGVYVIAFKDESIFLLFKLRWSEYVKETI
jgi:hypothetical protein